MNTRLPGLNALRAFEASARHLSFRLAAEELHVTPAAISQQIRGLEQQLDIVLFHRRVRSLELTDAGRAALPHLSEGFEKLLMGVDAMHLSQQMDFLTVSVPPSFGERWLVPRLDRLRTAHPEFEVRIDAKESLANFTNDGVDIAVRFGIGPYPPAVTERLLEIDSFPACSPSLLESKGIPKEAADLAGWTLLHASWSESMEAAPSWPMWLRASGIDTVDPEPGPRFSSEAMLVEAAIAGQGVALLTSALIHGELNSGRLVRLFPVADADSTEFSYSLVYPERHRKTPKVQAFREWMLSEVAGEAIS